MATGDVRMGLNGTFNYGTAGSQANTSTDNVDDVKLNMSKRTAEMIKRGKSWVMKKPYVTEANLTFKVWDVVGDAFMAALETAFVNNTRIALYPTTEQSGKGLDADFYVNKFDKSEDNDGFVYYDVQCDPTDEGRDPVYQ